MYSLSYPDTDSCWITLIMVPITWLVFFTNHSAFSVFPVKMNTFHSFLCEFLSIWNDNEFVLNLKYFCIPFYFNSILLWFHLHLQDVLYVYVLPHSIFYSCIINFIYRKTKFTQHVHRFCKTKDVSSWIKT